MATWKGIILAGGTGSRLKPLTFAISKQLMPVYDKPMIYYPLSVLMLAGIKDILIITNKIFLKVFESLLGDGSKLGIKITYKIQDSPKGIADAFIVGEKYISQDNVCLILGDNIFHGGSLRSLIMKAKRREMGATVFTYQVNNPRDYGIIKFDNRGNPLSLEEKPKSSSDNNAITGLYFFDNSVIKKAKSLKPSKRNELEITDVNKLYLKNKQLNVERLNRGTAWLDTGTFDSLHQAGSYIRTLENRTALKIGCPEEVAWRMRYITKSQLKSLAKPLLGSGYGEYLIRITNE